MDATSSRATGHGHAGLSAATSRRLVEHEDDGVEAAEEDVPRVARPRGLSASNGAWIAESPSREQLLAT